ncbi:hypothetical protein [Achromobacter ruhlandii]|uniref:hypothetical protein n=1 Tax=Achromobacter ruhlandii TaxID=72557 RepID=UPI001EEE468D|nr:hypothetical protein [Achromobacter ruhlandii]
MKRHHAYLLVIMSVLAMLLLVPLSWLLPFPHGFAKAHAKSDERAQATPTMQTPFSPPNGGREIRSLSVHPDGNDWLFVECVRTGDNRCDVMRYQWKTGKLYRYGLPAGYTYPYAHYSPQGNYIVMSRRRIAGDSDDEQRRSLDAMQILLMRSDGEGLQILPLARGNKLSPFMSLDESRIAFWRTGRILPPGQRLGLLDFDIWEFDRADATERPFAGIFKFVSGGQAQYLSDDEILFRTFGPAGHLSSSESLYGRSSVHRMRRADTRLPEPQVFSGIKYAEMPTMDRAGNLYLWGQTPRYGLTVIRIEPGGQRRAWQPGLGFIPQELICDPAGAYLASIYWDQPMDVTNRPGGLAMLDIATDTWTAISLPSWRDAEIIPVNTSASGVDNGAKWGSIISRS